MLLKNKYFMLKLSDSSHTPLLARGFRTPAAHQRKNAGEMGTGARQAESTGGGSCAAGAPVSRYAGPIG